MKKDLPVTVEITDTHIKVLQTKGQKNKPIIASCFVKQHTQYSDEQIIRSLSEVISPKKVQSERLTLIIPRRFVILKKMRLPSQNMDEIRKMVSLQLVSQIPYQMEDVVYDLEFLGRDHDGFSNVQVFIVHKEVCTRYVHIFDKLGITVSKMAVSSFGLLGWFNFQGQQKKWDFSQTVMLVNIDTANSEICFFAQEKLIFSRSVNYGSRDLSEEHLFGLLNQIDLSLGSFKKEKMAAEPSRLVIVSSLEEGVMLKERCEREFRMPVDIIPSTENVFSNRHVNLSFLKNQPGVSLASGLGMLLLDPKKQINLTPHEVHHTKRKKVQKRKIFMFMFLILLFFALLGVLLGNEYLNKQSKLATIKAQYNQIKEEASLAKEKIRFVEFFNDEMTRRTYVPDLFFELIKLAPEEISLRNVYFDETGRFSLQGYAETAKSINEFQSGMVKSPLFDKVTLEYATKRKIFNMEVSDFKITAQLTYTTR